MAFSARLLYFGLVVHVCSSRVFFMENERFVVVTCISYFFSRRKSVRAMDDRMQACCLNLDRWNDPPYLAAICLVRWCLVILDR